MKMLPKDRVSRSRFIRTPILILIIILLAQTLPVVLQAQVTTDGSLGPAVPVGSGTLPDGTSTDYLIGAGLGRQSGANLFHSFMEFGIETGRSATFTGPNDIHNILSRVTGGTQSWIDGLLRSTIPGANLFLMNPAGLFFGPHASLELKGSFHVTTADYLGSEKGERFYATPGIPDEVLSVAPPVAFGFLGENPSRISVKESVLSVPAGEILSLVGGDIEIAGNGASESAGLMAQSGKIVIASVGSEGEVVVSFAGKEPNIRADSFDRMGDMTLSEGALVNASGESCGAVVIRGGRLMVDNASIFSITEGDLEGAHTGINIDMDGDLIISNGGGLSTLTIGGGQAGDIQIRSEGLKMTGIPQTEFASVYIETRTGGTGDAGDVSIETGTLELRDASVISTNAYYGQGGNAGDLEILADSIFIAGPESSPDPFWMDFTGLDSSSGFMAGDGGTLRLSADHLILSNRSTLDAAAYGPGIGGKVEIVAGNMEVLTGSAILASAFGSGDGGNCKIQADRVLISGASPEIYTDITGHQSLAPSGIASQTGLNGGSAGDIQITAGSLEIRNGGRLGVETFGPGDGGNVEVTADHVRISGINENIADFLRSAGSDPKFAGASILAASYSIYLGDGATGNGGNIKITAKDIQICDGGLISSDTEAPGNGGNIWLSGDTITLSNGSSIASTSQIAWATTAGKSGDISITALGNLHIADSSVTTSADQAQGGNITIQARQQQLMDNALVSAESLGPGNAGTVFITADDTFYSDDSSVKTTATQAEGGEISITAGDIQLVNGSLVSAESSGPGDAGDILLSAGGTFLMRNSSVNTEAKAADGGNIKVDAEHMVHLANSQTTTSVGGGPDTVGGNVTIDPEYVILQNTEIIANAYEGKGGNIGIVSGCFLADPFSVLDASSALGIDGSVDIRAPVTHVSGAISPLQKDFKSAVELLREPCMARVREGKYSSFIVGGRDGLPIEPGGLLPSPMY